jgi:hypothetical protein
VLERVRVGLLVQTIKNRDAILPSCFHDLEQVCDRVAGLDALDQARVRLAVLVQEVVVLQHSASVAARSVRILGACGALEQYSGLKGNPLLWNMPKIGGNDTENCLPGRRGRLLCRYGSTF